MTIIVTGASGLIGRFTCQALRCEGYDVVAVDVTQPPDNEGNDLFEQVDIAQPEAWPGLLARHAPDAIIHLAALTTVASAEDPIAALGVNVMATGRLFEAARLIGRPRIVYASSVGVYGAPDRYDHPASEDALIAPGTVYAGMKAMVETLAGHYRDRHGLETIGLRPTVAYGPGRYSGAIGQINQAIRSAVTGEPFAWRRRFAPDCVHNPIHATDVAAAFCRAATGALLPRPVYNVGGPEMFTEAEMMAVIREMAVNPEHFGEVEGEAGPLVTYARIDCSTFPADSGVAPTLRFKDAIEWTRRHYASAAGTRQ